MRPTPLLLLGLLTGSSLAGGTPGDRAREGLARYERLARGAARPKYVSRGRVHTPRTSRHVAFAVAEYPITQRKSSSGSWRIKAERGASSGFEFRRMIVYARFKERVPAAALSKRARAWCEDHCEKAGDDVFLVERVQVASARFRKDRRDGAWRAVAVLWGPNWHLAADYYDLEVTLAR